MVVVYYSHCVFINKCCIYFGYHDSVFVIMTGLVDLAAD